ncbi:MAG: hypothetical protein E4H20_04165 [Spirochaetales bacterium]|nr:MAG: hypothetical protein E4H20_04165 [Spirochaetales bacterium]
MKDAWNFAQMDDYWRRYEPLTPWGQDHREARRVLVDEKEIQDRHDDIDVAAQFLADAAANPVSLDRLAYHLKRMPRLPLAEKDEYELIELFQVKKFLANYRGVLSVLDDRTRGRFNLVPACPGLAAELDRGGSDAETFYLADSYDPGLGACRASLAAIDAEIREARAASEERAKVEFGLSFKGREFLVVARSVFHEGAPDPVTFLIDPYDDGRVLVRLLPTGSAVAAMEKRERLLESEREAENAVIRRLSALASKAMAELRGAVAALTRWDIARAGAILADQTASIRPELDSSAMLLEEARFVPCADECKELGLEYHPLSARFDSGAVVLFGSNMGGKTVALKTMLFMQLLAQAGLFVPARRFCSHVYRRVDYVGELAGERLTGLSGFGFEIWRFQEAWQRSEGALIAFDEPARTTGSHEAEALLSALVEAYANGRGARAFFATHFRGVARVSGAEYRRMRGLDRAAACEALDADAPLPERLAGINRHMRYEIVDDDDAAQGESDALAIATMLGLDCGLVERAQDYFRKSLLPGSGAGVSTGH